MMGVLFINKVKKTAETMMTKQHTAVKAAERLLLLCLYAFVPVLTGCEKEIDIDYHEAERLYVAEATVTSGGTQVRLTTTRPVTVNSPAGTYVDGATVVVSIDGLPIESTLTYKGKGIYESPVVAMEGSTYHLDIDIDGQHYTSSSTVMTPPQLNSMRFVWKKMMTERMLFIDLRLQDTPNENNYYFMHLYRNDVGYRWAVMRDSENPGAELSQLFTCSTERAMNDGSDADALREGDEIRLEIRSIDKASYDYFYSLQLAASSNTNPLPNFTGGMLGYFSAFIGSERLVVFHRADVEEEE